MRVKHLLLGVLSFYLNMMVCFPGLASPQVGTGRYSSTSVGPTIAQRNPLMAIGQWQFAPAVHTVGKAITQVLMNTGYTLVPPAQQSVAVKDTLTKPLPLPDRKLGPMRVQTALRVLMGMSVFQLIVDPLHRLVNFKVKPTITPPHHNNKSVDHTRLHHLPFTRR